MKTMLRAAIIIAALALLAQSPANAGEGCVLVAEVTVEATKAGVWLVCVRTGNPVACKIAEAATAVGQSDAGDRLAKHGVQLACEWSVSRVGDVIAVFVKSNKEQAKEMKDTGDSLKRVQGLKLLEQKF